MTVQYSYNNVLQYMQNPKLSKWHGLVFAQIRAVPSGLVPCVSICGFDNGGSFYNL